MLRSEVKRGDRFPAVEPGVSKGIGDDASLRVTSPKQMRWSERRGMHQRRRTPGSPGSFLRLGPDRKSLCGGRDSCSGASLAPGRNFASVTEVCEGRVRYGEVAFSRQARDETVPIRAHAKWAHDRAVRGRLKRSSTHSVAGSPGMETSAGSTDVQQRFVAQCA